MRYAILYDFTGRGGRGTDEAEIEADNESDLRKKFFKIFRGYSFLRIRKIKEI